MSKRDLADIEATETVPLADHPTPESTYAALQASCGAVARGEGANVLPWRGKLSASVCLDLRGLDGGRNAGSKRLSNIPERAAVALMKLGTGRAALFGFDPDHCPIIASVRLRELATTRPWISPFRQRGGTARGLVSLSMSRGPQPSSARDGVIPSWPHAVGWRM